jgi:hypothetical protein
MKNKNTLSLIVNVCREGTFIYIIYHIKKTTKTELTRKRTARILGWTKLPESKI